MWRDDKQGGRLIRDEPTIIQCYVDEKLLESKAQELKEFLVSMGRATNQGAVGFVIDRHYLEIRL